MAVFRVEKNRNYTVMSNYHLRDQSLSLKAKGLMSMILSLPEGWHYSTRGLAVICKEGIGAISAGVKELELAGYVKRNQLRDGHGRLTDIEYVIYEQPLSDSPCSENPRTVNPDTDEPFTENPAGINIDITNTKKSNTNLSNTHSIPFCAEANRSEVMLKELEYYRAIIRENIDYDILIHDSPYNQDRIDEVVELLLETVCSGRKTIRIAGEDYPAETVKSRLLQLDSEHIRFVFDCMKENTTKVRNIRQYLLAALWNAPISIGNYYSARVNHDMYALADG